jgi:eukaryotic-like serine/threonine-protein kinase
VISGLRAAVKVATGCSPRFEAEARAGSLLRHENAIELFDHGVLPSGRAFSVMEHLEGRTLEARLRQDGRLTIDEALSILEPVAAALDAAHALGIAHCDVKPSNVFLADVPKLIDFGIARLLPDVRARTKEAASRAVTGTPLYMSPEQCRGVAVDRRTDIYSLGITAYRVLTGRHPFESEQALDLCLMHLMSAPRSLCELSAEISEAVSHAVLRMIEKDPLDRPASASDAIRSIREAISPRRVLLRVERQDPRPWLISRVA